MRRYGSLSWPERLRLLAVFLAAQVLVWIFFDGTGARLSLAVLTLAVLLVAVKTRKPVAR